MSKKIRLTEEDLSEIRDDFEKSLKMIKLSDGKMNFTKTFGTINRKATLYFTEIAYLKTMSLVSNFDKEVAWHGIAKRHDTEEDAYIISDILVYPQEVTGATVTTDQNKYQDWLMNHDDDVFNNIRMQGHSHVDMGVTPSTVDTSLYERLLDQLDDDMFYIFMILNKKGNQMVKIYDMAKNVLFETADVTVSVIDDVIGLRGFLDNAKSLVSDRKYTYTPPKNTDKKDDKSKTDKADKKSDGKNNVKELPETSGFYGGTKRYKKKKKTPTSTGYGGHSGSHYDGYYGDYDGYGY